MESEEPTFAKFKAAGKTITNLRIITPTLEPAEKPKDYEELFNCDDERSINDID